MVRLIALFNRPEDAAAFDAHYRDVHMPIVRRYPGLRSVRLHRLAPLPGPHATPFYLMAEMVFDSSEALDAAIASEAGRESGRDLRNFALGGVQLFIALDTPEDGSPVGG